MENVIYTWVHLSDIHMSHGSDEHKLDQNMVLQRLREDIVAGSERGEPKPNAIFLTGDMAFSGAVREEDEYEKSRVWLTTLVDDLGLSSADVFVIPGNHDVERDKYKNDDDVRRLVDALRKGTEQIDSSLANDKSRGRLHERLGNFYRFAESFSPVCDDAFHVDNSQLYWRVRLNTDDVPIELIGINTALLCQDNEDKQRLAIGKSQLSLLTDPPLPETQISILLSHHPVDWLIDSKDATNWIRGAVKVHCFGHIHDPASEELRGGGGKGFVQICGGATHCDESEPRYHGYNLASLVARDGKLFVHTWPRKWSEKRTRFLQDTENVPDGIAFASHLVMDSFVVAKPIAVAEFLSKPRRKVADPESKEFQKLVALVSRVLSPQATVVEGAKIKAKCFGELREVSVLVESKVGPKKVSVAVEARNHKRKLNKPDMQNVLESYLCEDDTLIVPHLVLICPNGFSLNAKRIASKYGIELKTLRKKKRLTPLKLNLDSPLFVDKIEIASADPIPSGIEKATVRCKCHGWEKGTLPAFLLQSVRGEVQQPRFKAAVKLALDQKKFFCATCCLDMSNHEIHLGGKIYNSHQVSFHLHAARKEAEMDVNEYELEGDDGIESLRHGKAKIDNTEFDFVMNNKACSLKIGPCTSV